MTIDKVQCKQTALPGVHKELSVLPSVQGSYTWPLHESSSLIIQNQAAVCRSILVKHTVHSCMLAQCCAVSAELPHQHMSISCSGHVCQIDNCLFCKTWAEALMQKHHNHMWSVFSWHRPQRKSISASSCAPLPSKAQSIEILCQKGAVLAVGRAEEEAGGATFHCLC